MDLHKQIAKALYLEASRRNQKLFNEFSDELVKKLWESFCWHYNGIVKSRADDVIINDKEQKVLHQIFCWCISSSHFNGDLRKGIWLAASQGFGKDVILKTIVNFFGVFGKTIREYSFDSFNKEWYKKTDTYFNMPIKINDINENGRIKLDRQSIPILEFLDYREINNLRRGILVSSNFLPEGLQERLEYDSDNKRLSERARECFNVFHIKDVESKRISNTIII